MALGLAELGVKLRRTLTLLQPLLLLSLPTDPGGGEGLGRLEMWIAGDEKLGPSRIVS